MKILFWRSLVILFVVLGFIGAILPGMPTTVFLILAAWAASKGWPQMDAWLLNHPKYGHTLRNWREHGTVPRKAKWFATIMMFCSGIMMLMTNAPWMVKVFTDLTMLIVAIWLWTRPEHAKDSAKENTNDNAKSHAVVQLENVDIAHQTDGLKHSEPSNADDLSPTQPPKASDQNNSSP